MKNKTWTFLCIPASFLLSIFFTNLDGFASTFSVIQSDNMEIKILFNLKENDVSKNFKDGSLLNVVYSSSQILSTEDLSDYSFYCAVPEDGFDLDYQVQDSVVFSDIKIKDNSSSKKLIELVAVGYIRDIKIAKIAVNPFCWKEKTKEVQVIKTLEVDLKFHNPIVLSPDKIKNITPPFGKLFQEILINDFVIERSMDSTLYSENLWNFCSKRNRTEDLPGFSEVNNKTQNSKAVKIKIPIKQTGVYRIKVQDLINVGFDIANLDPAKLSMKNIVWDVPFKLSSEQDLKADDYVEFFGSNLDIVYTDTNVYWLSEGDKIGKRIKKESGRVSGNLQTPHEYFKTDHFENNEVIWETIPNGLTDDNWQWKKLTANSEEETGFFNCDLENLADDSENYKIRIELGAYSSIIKFNPDHHTSVELNGKAVGDVKWDGNVKLIFEADIARSDLIAGNNEIKITELNDLGLGISDPDIIYVNWIEIDCWHTFKVIDNELFIKPKLEGSFQFEISGFTEQPIYIYDISDPSNSIEIVDFTVKEDNGSYMVLFDRVVDSNSNFYLFTESYIHESPQLSNYHGSDIKDTSNKADYIIITHEDFHDSILPLKEYREKAGLEVRVVDIGEIYDEFSYGIFYPPAIQLFLKYAYENWQKPSPTYVLLVGDATSRYRNWDNSPNKNFVPPYLMYFDPYSLIPADNYYVSVSGDDYYPDMIIGRIPAQTTKDVEVCIDKITSYENGEPSSDWNKTVTLISGSGETPIPFREVIDGLVNLLPDYYNPKIIDFMDYSGDRIGDLKPAILDSFNSGSLLVNYVGHGNLTSWSNGALNRGDIAALTNEDKLLFFVTMTCLNGYFAHSQEKRCLAEELLFQNKKGAIACWSPAGFGSMFHEKVLNEILFRNLFLKDIRQIGLLTTLTKIESPASESLIQSMTLFGDPALILKVPYYESPAPRLEIISNQSSYSAGDILQIFVRIYNDATVSQGVDLVAAFKAGDSYLFYPTWTINLERSRINIPAESLEIIEILNAPVSENIPLGDYYFYFAILKVDTYDIIDGIKELKIEIRE